MAGPVEPDWAQHFVETLRAPLLKFKEKVGGRISLVMWSDCAGMCTERYAAELVATEVKQQMGLAIEFKLHSGSGPGPIRHTRHCIDFVRNNYQPTHFAADIFKRDFNDGLYECTMCQSKCWLPPSGVDTYWCRVRGVECGKHLGLIGVNFSVLRQAINTIKFMKPPVFSGRWSARSG